MDRVCPGWERKQEPTPHILGGGGVTDSAQLGTGLPQVCELVARLSAPTKSRTAVF